MVSRRSPLVGLLLALTGGILPVVGLASPAGAAVSGYEVIEKIGVDGFWSKTATAKCPVGKRLIGMGAKVWVNTLRQPTLNEIRPDAALTSVTVSAHLYDSGQANPFFPIVSWDVRAIAVCATAPPGLVLANTDPYLTTPYASTSPTSAGRSATCPAGKKVLSVGGRITGGAGQVGFTTVRPKADLSGVQVAARELSSYGSSWSLFASAICADALPGLELKETLVNGTAHTFLQDEGYCPAGKVATGGGITTSSVSASVKVTTVGWAAYVPSPADFHPEYGGTMDYRGSAVTNVGQPAAWSITGYGVCVTK